MTCHSGQALAQAAQPVVSVCSGSTVTVPLGGLLGNVTLGVDALDPNGNLVTLGPGTNCSVAVTSPNGITIGGGRIDGLGGNGAGASAPDASSIAIGNGSAAGAANAAAYGTGANAATAGSVALGAGSTANRLNAANELFSGAGLRTTLGVASVGSATNERQITNVAGGTAATDAANVRQLTSVGNSVATSLGGGAGFNATTGAYTAPTYTVQGAAYNNVGGALGALDGATTINTTNITNLLNGTAGLVRQDPTTRVITVGAATNGGVVNVAGTAGSRQITGVAAGVGATDAVNVTQLNNAVGGGSPALASENSGGAPPAVASGLRSVAVGFGSVATAPDTISVGAAGAERRLVNVAAGNVAAGSTDGVNGGQLFTTRAGVAGNAATLGGGAGIDFATGTYTPPAYAIQGATYNTVGGALGALDGATTTNTTNVTNLLNGTAGLVRQDQTTRVITVGATTNGGVVNVAGTAGNRQVGGVAAGSVATDAVNVAQLTSAIAGVTVGIGSIALASENSGLAAPPIASGLRSVAVGFGSVATAPDTFSVGRSGAERRVVNVAAGTLAAGSTDAVNGAQLFATNNSIATNAVDVTTLYNRLSTSLGGGAAYDPGTRNFTFPSYSIRGSNYNSVGSAFAAVDSALASISGGGGGTAPIVARSSDPANNPVATGDNSVAGGLDAAARGNQSAAIGDSSAANGTNASSFGSGAAAMADGSSAIGSASQAMALNTTAIGMGATADFEGSTAIGAGARAIADPTTAVGYQALASGNNAVAVGALSSATGTDATSIGAYSTASGNSSTALGRQSVASGDNSTAIGHSASAGGVGSIAIGQAASANQDNAVAIGHGVNTTRPNQVAIGGAQNTYTLAGLGSGASNASQSGGTRFVTTDAAGNLGTTEYGPQDMGSLSNRVSQLGSSVDQLGRVVVQARREARSGIASAMAMTSAPMPSAGGKTSWAANGSVFQGEWASGFAVAHRLDVAIPIAVTAGYSYGQAAGHGVRMGLAGEF